MVICIYIQGLQFNAQFLVLAKNGTKIPAFALHTETVAAGDLTCAQNTSTKVWAVRFNLTEVSLNVTLKESAYGQWSKETTPLSNQESARGH